MLMADDGTTRLMEQSRCTLDSPCAAQVSDVLQRIAGVPDVAVRTLPIAGAAQQYHYRNKMEVPMMRFFQDARRAVHACPRFRQPACAGHGSHRARFSADHTC